MSIVASEDTFVYYMLARSGERVEKEDLWRMSSVELHTKMGMILLMITVPEQAKDGRPKAYVLEVAVPTQCCTNINLDDFAAITRCRNCKAQFGWNTDFALIKPVSSKLSEWQSEDEFIEVIAPSLGQDALTNIVYACDLYAFLRNTFVARGTDEASL